LPITISWPGAFHDVFRQYTLLHVELGAKFAHYHRVVVKIIKQPHGKIDGVRLDRYLVGQSYDVPHTLADYLVLQGYAAFEMRGTHRSRPPGDRRQYPR
jgi:hypothetical protein